MCTDVPSTASVTQDTWRLQCGSLGEQGTALCTGAVPEGFLGLAGWLELQEQG